MKPQPISWSRLSRFKNCPKQFYEITIAKRFADATYSADGDWGMRAHAMFQDYLKGKRELTSEFKQYRDYLDSIRNIRGQMQVEIQQALNTSLQPCNWWADDVFIRAVADVMHIQEDKERILVIDHKFGKKKPTDQLALTALVLFHTYPKIKQVKTAYFWMREGIREPEEYSREHASNMWNYFLPDLAQYKEAFQTETWQPRQSGLCHGWCPVTDCEFWKPKRPKR